MKRIPRTKTPSGYTLVEITVVISILALLLSILIPLLSRSRETAYRTQCAANMKQLSTAFNLYSNDWYGYWPAPGGLRGDKTYWSQSGQGGLNAYIRQSGVNSIWCCPLQDSWNGSYSARTYSMNGYLRTPWDNEYKKGNDIILGITSQNIPLPSKTILLYEGALLVKSSSTDLDYIYRCANWTYVRGYSNDTRRPELNKPWHGKLNNYLYCDGHITARRPGKAYGSLSTGSEMYQWYVDKTRYMNTYRASWQRTAPWE